MRRFALGILLIAVLALPKLAQSHEVRPAYLRIQQLSETEFSTAWRVPARGELRLAIYLEMPDHCKVDGSPLSWSDGSVYVDEASYRCPGGLTGHEVRISGLNSVMTDALARYERLDGTTQVARLSPANDAFLVTASEDWRQVVGTYFVLGIEHILLGIDHLLFVLALLLLVPNLRMLV